MRISALRAGTATLVVLAGCRTLPPAPPPGVSWDVRRPQLQSLEHFQLRGRVAVASSGEGFNANLRWTQDGDHSQVTLEGPLGVGGAQLSAEGDQLTVVTSQGERIESAAAHAALAARLGFDPPLSSLRYWVLGVPDPKQPASESLDPAVLAQGDRDGVAQVDQLKERLELVVAIGTATSHVQEEIELRGGRPVRGRRVGHRCSVLRS